MHIRKGKESDAESCLFLFKLDQEEYWDEEDFVHASNNECVIFLVAEEKNAVVGYVLGFILPTKKQEVMLHETRTHKDLRGRGIGTLLVDAFCKEAFGMGAKIVLAEIVEKLLGFYIDKCGFKKGTKWIEVVKEAEL